MSSALYDYRRSVSACEAMFFVAGLKVTDDNAHHISQALLSSGVESSLLWQDFNKNLTDQLGGEENTL